MPKNETNSADGPVVNWNPPSKHDIVERALSDGTTDPKEIVSLAADRNVKMTVEEVKTLIAAIKKQG